MLNKHAVFYFDSPKKCQVSEIVDIAVNGCRHNSSLLKESVVYLTFFIQTIVAQRVHNKAAES